MNKKITILSLIALACVILAFVIDWLFLIPAIIIVIINQRELLKNKKQIKK